MSTERFIKKKELERTSGVVLLYTFFCILFFFNILYTLNILTHSTIKGLSKYRVLTTKGFI